MSETATKKIPRAIAEFDEIVRDPQRTPRQRIDDALAYVPDRMPGANEVRVRQKLIRDHAQRLQDNLKPEFTRHTYNDNKSTGLKPEDAPAYWVWIGLKESSDLRNALSVPRTIVDSDSHCTEKRPLLGEIKDACSFRRAITSIMDRRYLREYKSGDRDLVIQFMKWYSQNHRPLHRVLDAEYSVHPKNRGRARVLQGGWKTFEALLDIDALKKSGWIPDAPRDFDLTAILNYDPWDTDYGREMTMRQLRGESTEGLMPGGTLSTDEIRRDLQWALTAGTPSFTAVIPVGYRIIGFNSDRDFFSLDSKEKASLLAPILGLPQSRIKKVIATSVISNREALKQAAAKALIERLPENSTQDEFSVYLIDEGARRPLVYFPHGVGLQAREHSPAQRFRSLDDARQTVTCASYPASFGATPRLEVVKHTSVAIEIVTPRQSSPAKKEVGYYFVTAAVQADFKDK